MSNDPDADKELHHWIDTNSVHSISERIAKAEFGLHQALIESKSDQALKDLARYVKDYADLKKAYRLLENKYERLSNQTEAIVALNQKQRRQIGQLKRKSYERV